MKRFSTESQELLLKKIRDIPSLPEVVNRILLLLSKPNAPASEIAKLISYDPGLTSRVLRMVNSAAYGFQRQISSVQHAIMILGFNTVRGLVLSASIYKLLEKTNSQTGLDQKENWSHSLMTAVIARVLGEYFHIPEVDDTFSAGMLHDVGKMVLDVYFAHDYQEVLRLAGQKGVPSHGDAYLDVEQEVLGTNHSEVGSFLANKWKLPVTITHVIEYHHKPQDAPMCQPLVYTVVLANLLSRYIYLSEEKEVIIDPVEIPESVRSHFGLEDDAQMGALLSFLKEGLASRQDLFEVFART